MLLKIFLLFISYLIGSIPSGYWFSKYFFKIDVTKKGSGNIGATNVARVLGKNRYFFLIFAFDFGKAFLFLHFLSKLKGLFTFELLLFSGALLLLGNCYSIFMNFRGGKGVSTVLGILAALFPQLFFIALFGWAVVAFIYRRVSIASQIGIFSILPAYFFLYEFNLSFDLFLFFIVFMVLLRHR